MSAEVKWLKEAVMEVEAEIQSVIEREVKRFAEKFALPIEKIERRAIPDQPFAELYYEERVIVNNQYYDIIFRNFLPRNAVDLRNEDIPKVIEKYGETGLLLARKITEKIGGRIAVYDDDGDLQLFIVIGNDSIKIRFV